jgi:hypothetical protein
MARRALSTLDNVLTSTSLQREQCIFFLFTSLVGSLFGMPPPEHWSAAAVAVGFFSNKLEPPNQLHFFPTPSFYSEAELLDDSSV